MRVAVDVMGGDFAPGPPVEGAVRAARATGCAITLVGPASLVAAELGRHDARGLDIAVVNAPDIIPMHETSPASLVRARPDNSISRGMSLVRHGEADAFVTMGHTGAALAGASFRLGRLHGVYRPALAIPFPTTRGRSVLIDIGANSAVRPVFLAQWAMMGSAYAERVLGIANPRVGILSNGEERGKGSPEVLGAIPLLEASALNFVGNLEGGDLAHGAADVVVVDGFTGNILMKFAEAVPSLIGGILRESLAGDLLAAPTGLLVRRAFRLARPRVDYRETGGAILLGVRGVVIIGHGRSDGEAVATAIRLAARAVDHHLAEAIETGLARYGAVWTDHMAPT